MRPDVKKMFELFRKLRRHIQVGDMLVMLRRAGDFGR